MIPLPLLATVAKKYWKHIVLVVAVSVAGYMLYDKVRTDGYNSGFTEANIACEKRMNEYKKDLADRIASLENTSSKLADTNDALMLALKSDYKKILKSIEGKPLYVVEQGVCKPSPDAVNAINEAVEKANRK